MKTHKINNSYYNSLYEKFGDTSLSLGWRGKSNLKRFDHLIEDFKLNDSSVLDVGCGLGHLINHLKKKYIKTYMGIDINSEFIKKNKKKFKLSKYKFKNISLEKFRSRGFDYVIQNGMFNLKANQKQYKYVEACLRKMFYLCNYAVSSNFISSQVKIRYSKNFYYDPVKILKICYSITPNLILKNNFFPYEFTIVLFKEKKINEDSYFKNI